MMQYETNKAVKFHYKTTQKTFTKSFITTMIINGNVTCYKFIKSFSKEPYTSKFGTRLTSLPGENAYKSLEANYLMTNQTLSEFDNLTYLAF